MSRLKDDVPDYEAHNNSSCLNREDAEAWAQRIVEKAKSHCLGYKLYEMMEKPLLWRRIWNSPPWYVVITFAWSTSFALIFLFPSLLLKSNVTLSAGAVVAAIGLFGPTVVRYAYRLVPIATRTAKDLPRHDTDRFKMFEWIVASFDMRKQVLVASTFTLCAVGSLILIDVWVPKFPISAPSYAIMIISSWMGASAVYWVRIPQYINLLNKMSLSVFPLDPRNTPAIQEMKKGIVDTLLPIGIGLAILLLLWRWIIPYIGNSVMSILMMSWYAVIGLLFSVYYFASMGLLARLVKRGKQQVLNDIQRQLQNLYLRLDSLTEQEWETFERLLSIYEQVQKAPETLVDRRSITRYIFSLVLQGLPLVTSVDMSQLSDLVKRVWAGLGLF